jgi:hypothetical protein
MNAADIEGGTVAVTHRLHRNRTKWQRLSWQIGNSRCQELARDVTIAVDRLIASRRRDDAVVACDLAFALQRELFARRERAIAEGCGYGGGRAGIAGDRRRVLRIANDAVAAGRLYRSLAHLTLPANLEAVPGSVRPGPPGDWPTWQFECCRVRIVRATLSSSAASCTTSPLGARDGGRCVTPRDCSTAPGSCGPSCRIRVSAWAGHEYDGQGHRDDCVGWPGLHRLGDCTTGAHRPGCDYGGTGRLALLDGRQSSTNTELRGDPACAAPRVAGPRWTPRARPTWRSACGQIPPEPACTCTAMTSSTNSVDELGNVERRTAAGAA